MEKSKAEEALEALGISVEDMENAEKELESKGLRRYRYTDNRVCACGHGVTKHTVTNGVVYCKPSRMECPCRKMRPVLEAEDTRRFIYRTNGSGPMHALTRGIMSCIESDKAVTWIVDLACDRCGEKTGNVVPVPVTQNGRASSDATGFDALLCPVCREEV